MRLYHKVFVALKVMIVTLVIISKLNISNYSHHLEEVIEDVFAVFVGVVIVFLFWPWKERRLDKHDKLIALSAGTLLLITKNYAKLYKEIMTLTRNVYMTLKKPLHHIYLL
jgi:hypothetical protein